MNIDVGWRKERTALVLLFEARTCSDPPKCAELCIDYRSGLDPDTPCAYFVEWDGSSRFSSVLRRGHVLVEHNRKDFVLMGAVTWA